MSTIAGKPTENADLQIAEALRQAILTGKLRVDQRLPGEQELALEYGVSRPTVREALKRLAAQNLIRTRRGASGGSFVNQITWSEAHAQLVTIATLLVSMTPIDAREISEARLALLSGCVPLIVERSAPNDIRALRAEIAIQNDNQTSDEEFCASDVRFYRLLVDIAGNAVLSFQMAGVVEAMQPLLNMITYRSRDRDAIASEHASICNCLERHDTAGILISLTQIADYTTDLVRSAQIRRTLQGNHE